MKPIAIVHWTEDGVEHSREHDNLPYLQAHIRRLQRDDTMFIVCVASTTFPLPSLAPEDGRAGEKIDRRNETITAI